MHLYISKKLDRFVFIKNGYSFFVHLVPFALAALLLLTLSVPKDNLLLKLVDVLREPDPRWLPAALLTGVTLAVYLVTMRVQIARAYLKPDHLYRKTLLTAGLYGGLCTAMAYVVLASAGASEPISVAGLWACGLLALLSLNGIGWPISRNWVEALGVRCPDYADAQFWAKQMVDHVDAVRRKARGEPDDVGAIKRHVEKLRSSVEANLKVEPEWVREELRTVSVRLGRLVSDLERRFPTDDTTAVADFAAACNYEKKAQYAGFQERLEGLSVWWPSLGDPGKAHGATA